MFGYVVINKAELKIKDYELYGSFYCGLCQTLKRRHHRIAQLALNNDMTFLAVLLSALYEPAEHTRFYRCPLHPTQKKLLQENAYIDYAADMTIVLTYLKCEDNWQDERSRPSRMYQKLLKNSYEKVYATYPQKCEAIVRALQENSCLEQQGCRDLDKLSALSGRFLKEVFVYQDDAWKPYLERLGDYMGRFIYLLDAYDDLKEDAAKQRFNPLSDKERDSGFEERLYRILEMTIAEAADAFEMLPILQYSDILRNILYSGVWSQYVMIRKKRTGEQDG